MTQNRTVYVVYAIRQAPYDPFIDPLIHHV
jgi:hypothetical protein